MDTDIIENDLADFIVDCLWTEENLNVITSATCGGDTLTLCLKDGRVIELTAQLIQGPTSETPIYF